MYNCRYIETDTKFIIIKTQEGSGLYFVISMILPKIKKEKQNLLLITTKVFVITSQMSYN